MGHAARPIPVAGTKRVGEWHGASPMPLTFLVSLVTRLRLETHCVAGSAGRIEAEPRGQGHSQAEPGNERPGRWFAERTTTITFLDHP